MENKRIKLHLKLFFFSMQVSKRGLCAFDNKRFLLADGIHSLAYGHKSITNHVRNIPPRRGAGDEVLTLAVARNRGILQNRQKPIIPLGQNPQDPHPVQVLFAPDDPHGLESGDQDTAPVSRKRTASGTIRQSSSSTSVRTVLPEENELVIDDSSDI